MRSNLVPTFEVQKPVKIKCFLQTKKTINKHIQNPNRIKWIKRSRLQGKNTAKILTIHFI